MYIIFREGSMGPLVGPPLVARDRARVVGEMPKFCTHPIRRVFWWEMNIGTVRFEKKLKLTKALGINCFYTSNLRFSTLSAHSKLLHIQEVVQWNETQWVLCMLGGLSTHSTTDPQWLSCWLQECDLFKFFNWPNFSFLTKLFGKIPLKIHLKYYLGVI